MQGYQHHLHLGLGDLFLQLGLELTPLGLELTLTRLGRFEGLGDAVALGGVTSVLCAPLSLPVTALRGFVFPLISTVCDFGELTHGVRSHQPLFLWSWGRLGFWREPLG